MALKGDRYLAQTDISFFMDQVAERGGVVCMKTAGSGAALDQQAAEVEYKADPSGAYAVGVLLPNMVNKDLTQTHLNFQKDEAPKGSKVGLMQQGFVVTNMFLGTPTGGAKAYLGVSGLFTPTRVANGNTPAVGRFESTVDEDGYVKVRVMLPQISDSA